MYIKDPLYAMIEDNENMVEEFFIGEKNIAMLPMWDNTEDFTSFVVINCAQGDVTILYDDGKDDQKELSMSSEELTSAINYE
jgi:hypothetical protein